MVPGQGCSIPKAHPFLCPRVLQKQNQKLHVMSCEHSKEGARGGEGTHNEPDKLNIQHSTFDSIVHGKVWRGGKNGRIVEGKIRISTWHRHLPKLGFSRGRRREAGW